MATWRNLSLSLCLGTTYMFVFLHFWFYVQLFKTSFFPKYKYILTPKKKKLNKLFSNL